jgi:hypothetical protein
VFSAEQMKLWPCAAESFSCPHIDVAKYFKIMSNRDFKMVAVIIFVYRRVILAFYRYFNCWYSTWQVALHNSFSDGTSEGGDRGVAVILLIY